jgi:hypothetical protein
MKNSKSKENKLANQLKEAGYSGLFQYGERSLSDSIWQNGENQNALLNIVSQSNYDDYIRLLASEILYEKNSEFPSLELCDTLAYIYTQALALSGRNEGALLSGNLWGFMYFSDINSKEDYGELGTHLMKTGKKSIPNLIRLLNDNANLYYEGSQESTLGNSLRYRVKDAAAYFVGKLTGIPVKFFENHADRDAEIERLKEKLK